MTTHAPPVAAVVLAGGRSTRMGRDKALLRLADGRTLLQRQLALLHSLAPSEVLVSARHEQELGPLPPSVRRVNDDGTRGPLGGLLAALQATKAGALLVLAVDLPRITPEVLRELGRQPRTTIARSPAGLQPLVARYGRELQAPMEQAAAEGRYGLSALWRDWLRTGAATALAFPAEEPFYNWNTPGSWE